MKKIYDDVDEKSDKSIEHYLPALTLGNEVNIKNQIVMIDITTRTD